MHLSDLKEAVAEGRLTDIEDGFKTLIQWPNHDRLDGSNAAVRRVMLREVCHSLAGNDRIMPGGVVDLLATNFEGLAGRTYAASARVVLDNLPAFSSRLARSA